MSRRWRIEAWAVLSFELALMGVTAFVTHQPFLTAFNGAMAMLLVRALHNDWKMRHGRA